MTHEQLISIIEQEGVEEVARVLKVSHLMIEKGWDLTLWRALSAPGAVLFYRVDEGGIITADTRVMVINAAHERERWEAMAREESDAPIVVVLQNGGVPRSGAPEDLPY